MSTANIRPATAADLAAINAIYNHYVVTSTATFAMVETTLAEREAWWEEHAAGFPVLVAVEGEFVLGWASLSPYSGRCGYRETVESSVYLAPDRLGRGLGTRLLGDLLDLGTAGGFHSVVAFIESGQAASLALHRKLGYAEAGRLREVGLKFDRRLDVVMLQKLLRENSA